MKKIVMLILVLIILLSVVEAAEVDSQVEDELKNDELVKVVVKLKDKPAGKQRITAAHDISKKELKRLLTDKKDMVKGQQEKVLSRLTNKKIRKGEVKAQASKKGFKLRHAYTTINGFSAKIDKSVLEELKNDPDVESINIDYPVQATLTTSVPQINGTKARTIQVNSMNITGAGETICIVDTGIDYSHEGLGSCNITRVVLNGTTEAHSLESPHPYASSTVYNYTIYKPGYSKIAVHFSNMSIETNWDLLKIYDKNWSLLGSFSGSHLNVWSPHGEGDTLNILWETDENVTDYGFVIDEVINGTANTTYDWSSCPKVIDGWDFVNSDGDPYDGQGHGTHVAGIAASTNETYKGVAPDAKLIAIKVLDDSASGSGTSSDIVAGIDWCVNRSADYNISVISMSLGTNSKTETYCNNNFAASAIDTAVGLDIMVAVASGNCEGISCTSGIAAPACVENATPVGAVDDSDGIIYQRGALLSILAPGATITSLKVGGGVVSFSGTSMATPHVAGAAALMKQFVRLQNGSVLSPKSIEHALNDTGLSIDDSGGSGRNYSRIDVYNAILSLDSVVPNVTITAPANDSFISVNGSVFINATINDSVNAIDSCLLEFEGMNTTMNMSGSGSFVYCSLNKTVNSTGTVVFTVYANDSQNNVGIKAGQVKVNQAPVPVNVSINSTDHLNRTNGTLLGLFDISDPDNDQYTNETKWYNNSAEILAFRNLTSIGSGNTTKGQNWTFSVRVYDGTNYSNWTNSSGFIIANAAPEFSLIGDLTILETQMFNLTINASDLDGDNLTYGINDSRFSQDNNSFTWLTNITSNESFVVGFNVSDGSLVTVLNFSLKVVNAQDLDNDGNPDFNDTDDDNDGLNDSIDKLTGNKTTLSGVSVGLFVNSSANVSQQFSGIQLVNITDEQNRSILVFNWNFTNLTLTLNFSVDYASSNGTLVVSGLNLSNTGFAKTLYINKSSSTYNYVCVVDAEVASISAVSDNCNQANEVKVPCTGTNGQYACTDLNSEFKVGGLNHSAVKGIFVDGGGGGGSGGGGGGSSICEESWSCSLWSSCVNGIQARNCTDENACGTVALKPAETQSCHVEAKKKVVAENIAPQVAKEEEEPVKGLEEEPVEEIREEPVDSATVIGIIILISLIAMIYMIKRGPT